MFKVFDSLSPEVSVKQNFDDLLVAQDHPSRSLSDTFYVTNDKVLRTHTSAHQSSYIGKEPAFLVVGDVYRRDEIDATHYPVFQFVFTSIDIFM